MGFDAAITPWTYFLNQWTVVVGYLGKILWPNPMLLDYGYPLRLNFTDVWLPGVLLLLSLGATGYALARRPSVGFLPAWFFLLLAPTSTLLPIVNEVGAERRVYLSAAAVVVLFVLAAGKILDRALPSVGRRRRVSAALLALVAVALSAATWHRNRDHQEPVRLWETVVSAAPANPRGHTYLGLAFADDGQLDAAVASYRRAVVLKPDYPDAHNNLGIALGLQGRNQEAVDHFRRALQLRPDFAQAQANLRIALEAAASGRN